MESTKSASTRAFLVAFVVSLALVGCDRDPEPARSEEDREGDLTLGREGRDATEALRMSIESARRFASEGHTEEAAKEYVRALERAPHDAALWLEFGRLARERRRDPRGAELAFRKAVELVPDSAEAHGSLGLALFDLGDHEGASAELQAALSLGPADAPWRTEVERILVLAHLRQRSR